MKVLIAGPRSVHVSNYCRAIKKHVEEIILVSENEVDIPEASHKYIVNLRGLNIFKWISAIRTLKNIIEKEKPDVVHVHQINRLAFFISKALKNLKIPFVATAWGSDVLLVPQKNFLYKKMIASTLHRANAITADSFSMITAMKAIDNSNKYHLLQYGIDPIPPALKERIIFSNRMHEAIYNIDNVIKYFAEFSKNHSEWQLFVAGEGTETMNLKHLASQLNIDGKIKFLGWLDQETNNSIYARSTIYVSMPSNDGTSVSLLEAMSANCIPVVSDLPVSKEWITDGLNGIINRSGINPFEEAIKIDQKQCVQINTNKIASSAVREKTIKYFYEIYSHVCLKNIN